MHRLCRISAIASTVVLSLAMVMLTPAAAAPRSSQPSFFVLSPIALDVAPSITHHRSDRAGETKREKPLLVPGGNNKRPKPGSGGADGALQTSATTPLGTTTGLSFDGVGIGLGGYADC